LLLVNFDELASVWLFAAFQVVCGPLIGEIVFASDFHGLDDCCTANIVKKALPEILDGQPSMMRLLVRRQYSAILSICRCNCRRIAPFI
jgi:hypothetical protein